MLHLELPHIDVLCVKGMQYEGTLSSLIRGTSLFADFNLEYYTEVQIWQKEGELAKNVKLTPECHGDTVVNYELISKLEHQRMLEYVWC